MLPSQMTATGVSGLRPPASRASAIAGAFSTAIISSRVPRSRATASQSVSESGCPGGRCPEMHGEVVRDAAVGDRDAGQGGDGDRAGQPRDHGDRYAGLPAGHDLLVAAAEDEAVAALEPDHPLAGPRPVDEDPVDLLLLRRPAARQLRDVDQLDVRGQLAEQLARGQPVGDHDVGLHQRLAPGDRDQLGVTRAAADQHHAGRPVALVAGDDRALAQPLEDLVAHRGAAPRLAVARARRRSRLRAGRPPGSRRWPGSRRPRARRRSGAARHPR